MAAGRPTMVAIPAGRSRWAPTATSRRRRRPTRSRVRRVLDRPDAGDQRGVRCVRASDRLRHGRRAAARPAPVPRRAGREPRARIARVHRHARARSTCATCRSGGRGRRARAGGGRTAPGSGVADLGDHPVVHVAHEDAVAYAEWVGAELPTEARVGARRTRRPRRRRRSRGATTLGPDGRLMANHWNGDFPWRNTLADGFARTSPVGSFPPNGYGLCRHGRQRVGVDGRLVRRSPSRAGRRRRAARRSTRPAAPPRRPATIPPSRSSPIPRKVIKGGSHLCADSYCLRYRPAARRPQMIDTGTSHLGFRCVPDERRIRHDRRGPARLAGATRRPRRRSSTSSSRVDRRRTRPRAARRAHRHVRQRRHAVVREADADPAGVHPRAPRRDGGRRRVAARPAAVEGGRRARHPLARRR